MRYLGGKARIAKDIAGIIAAIRPDVVIEPFCGALNVSIELAKLGIPVIARDIDEDLIAMWVAVQNGWDPPSRLTKEEYEALRGAPPSPLRTFVGYGCSFSGKWFGGYAEDTGGRNYCGNARNSINKIRHLLQDIEFFAGSFQECSQVYLPNAVYYCDPPYSGTTPPGQRGAFDHQIFWEWVRLNENPCFVSEYTAPEDMVSVWERDVKTDMHTKEGHAPRTERLFLQKEFANACRR